MKIILYSALADFEQFCYMTENSSKNLEIHRLMERVIGSFAQIHVRRIHVWNLPAVYKMEIAHVPESIFG